MLIVAALGAFLALLPEAGLTVFAALMLAAWCKPAVDRLVHLGWQRGLAALLLSGLFFFAAVAIVYFLLPHSASEMASAQSFLSTEQLQQRLSLLFSGGTELAMGAGASRWQLALEPAMQQLLDSVHHAFMPFRNHLHAGWPVALVVAVLTFFLLRDHASLSRSVVALASNRSLARWIASVETIKTELTVLAQYFMPRFLLAGVMAYAAFFLIGAPFAFGLAVIAAAALMVPYFGALLAMVPAILISVVHAGSWSIAVAIVLAVATLRLIDHALFGRRQPAVITAWHPLAVILVLLIGWALWGFWGVYMSVPLASGNVTVVRQIRASYEAFGHG